MEENVYHYTSVDAFVSMLKKMKEKDSNELVFWASNVHYMNDPNELSFLYDELMNAMPELERDLEIKDMPFSLFLSLRKNQLGISFDLFKDIKDNVFNNIFKNAYAVSFSKQKDALPMWSLYGCDGSGLCLEFDYNALKEYFSETKTISRIIELHYYLKEIDIWPKVAAFYILYHDKVLSSDGNNDLLRQCREFIARVLMEIAPLLKNQSYAYEKEVRLFNHFIMTGDADDIVAKAKILPWDKKEDKIEPPKVRVRNGSLIPYKEISIPIDFITKIFVGPTSNPQLQSEALKVFLNEMGQERITVEKSEIPYRKM
jgi:hypothetical protein